MQDGRKTKAQLIRELEEIRRRLAEEDGSKNPRDMLVFLQALIDTIPSSIFYKDREGIYRGCNRAYENFLGLKKREIVGKTLHEIFPGDLADKYGEMDRKLFENPGQQEYEWQMSSSDGTRHDVMFRKATFLNVDGSVGGLVGVMVDITEFKRAQEALRVSEEKYRNIFENAVEGIFQSTPDGRLLSVNPTQAKIFGYDSPQEMIDTFSDIAQGHYVHPEDRRKFLEICNSQGFIQGFEAEFYTKTGEKIWVFLNARTVRNAAGEVLYYEGFAEDITKRKRAEQALKESERYLAEIIDFLPDATFVVDTAGRILVWNRAMEDMSGVKAEDVIGKGNYEYALPFYGERKPMLVDLLSHPDPVLESQYAVFERKKDSLIAEGSLDAGGKRHFLLAKAASLYDNDGNIVGAIESIRDITQHKRAETELRKRKNELLIKSQSLEEVNVALKFLLAQREKDKEELGNSILANIQRMIVPYVDKLKNSPLGPKESAYVKVLELSLKDITSPFADRLSSVFLNLTSKEAEVARLVKEGKSTKEIAVLLNSTVRAIEFHRDNIRKKLGLNKSDRNLRSFLMSLS